MSERKFEGILDYLCGDIISKVEQREVRDELYDHLMSIYETNLACGMSEDEAEYNAVDHLGDTLALKKDLNKVHSKNPLRIMGSQITYTLYCSLLLFFLVSMHYKTNRIWCVSIALFAGICVWYVFSMRRIGADFKNASAFVFVLLSESILLTFSSVFYDFNGIALYIIITVTFLGVYFSTHLAIHKLLKAKRLQLENKMRPILSIIATLVAVIIANLMRFIAPEFSISTLAVFANTTCIFYALYINKFSDTLDKNGIKISYEVPVSKRAVAAGLTVIIILSASFAGEYVYYKKSDNKITSTDSLITDAPERKEIESILYEYGVYERYLAVLPDSEIEKYKDLKSPAEITLPDEYFKIGEHQNIFYDFDRTDDDSNNYLPWKTLYSDEWLLPLRQENGKTVYRLLRITDLSMPDDDYRQFGKYVAGVAADNLWSDPKRFGENIETDLSTELLLLADVNDNKTVYREFMKTYTGKNGEKNGCGFRIKEKTYLIYAVNLSMEGINYRCVDTILSFSFMKKPILLKYRSAYDISDSYTDENDSNNKFSVSRNRFSHKYSVAEAKLARESE